MLLKKILPIASVGAVAIAATPLFASCSCGPQNCTWAEGDTYKPMSPKKSAKYENNNELTKAYEQDVKTKHKIYSDDFVNFISHGGYTGSQETMQFDVKKINHETTSVGDGSTTIGGGEEYAFPITFTMSLTAKAEITANSVQSKLNYEDSTITFTNIPIQFIYFESQEVLGKEGSITQCFTASTNALIANKDWSIDMPELVYDKGTATFTLGENKIYSVENSLQELMSQQNLFNAFKGFLVFFTAFESNYYYNAEVTNE